MQRLATFSSVTTAADDLDMSTFIYETELGTRLHKKRGSEYASKVDSGATFIACVEPIPLDLIVFHTPRTNIHDQIQR